MRNYLTLIILTAIFFTSCKDVTQKSEKDTIILPDTTGFYAARNLKGLGVFIIGKSTYLNTLKNLKNEWRKNKRYDYFNYGKGLGESFSGLLEIKNDTTKTFQDNSLFSIHCLACKDTKAIGL